MYAAPEKYATQTRPNTTTFNWRVYISRERSTITFIPAFQTRLPTLLTKCSGTMAFDKIFKYLADIETPCGCKSYSKGIPMFCRMKFDIIFLLSQCKTTNFSVFLFSFSFVNGNRICLQFTTLYLFVVLVILDICKGSYMTDGSSLVPPLLNLRVLKNSSYISGLSSVPDVESHTHTQTHTHLFIGILCV